MNILLVFLAIALIGIVLYVTIKRRKPWKFLVVILIIIIGILFLTGFRFTASSALPIGSSVIEDINTNYGKAILYENVNDNTFGLAKVKRNLGFLYHYSGGTSKYAVERNKPFQVAGYGSNEEDGFMIGVRITNSDIKYIVVGNHLRNLTPTDKYHFNLETVKKYSDSYHIEEVTINHAFFVLNEYSEETWTIRALDKDGNLIADKLFGMDEVRYIDW
ncbi:hypothetical protein [Saliterribacillus persicus]|uniref:Uncharacterized protein n=1 Tax=Saliterribacillus persicus TaxID=930114 RepID=A0A368X9C6_9BACI|nr:hypothetical protein [Saliterribacillus persicus]RCW64563.1 hypothetical protein DFR57_11347 [Saliterribacillus persicus]